MMMVVLITLCPYFPSMLAFTACYVPQVLPPVSIRAISLTGLIYYEKCGQIQRHNQTSKRRRWNLLVLQHSWNVSCLHTHHPTKSASSARTSLPYLQVTKLNR